METADLSENVEETEKDPNPAQEGWQDASKREPEDVFDPDLEILQLGERVSR